MRILWVEKITNVEVMRQMNKEKEVIMTTKRRKLLYMEHIKRGETNQLLQITIQLKINKQRSIERKRKS